MATLHLKFITNFTYHSNFTGDSCPPPSGIIQSYEIRQPIMPGERSCSSRFSSLCCFDLDIKAFPNDVWSFNTEAQLSLTGGGRSWIRHWICVWMGKSWVVTVMINGFTVCNSCRSSRDSEASEGRRGHGKGCAASSCAGDPEAPVSLTEAFVEIAERPKCSGSCMRHGMDIQPVCY